MENRKVSNSFMKFFSKNAQAIEEVKKEEARAANVPVPVGTEGDAIITDIRFDKGKDKKNPDGSVKEGTDYCLMELKILEHPEHQGKTLKRVWYFSTTANATGVDRFGWFLNDIENLNFEGYREMRLAMEDPQQLVEFLLSQPRVVKFAVQDDPYDQREKKKVVLYPSDSFSAEVEHTNSVPGAPKAPPTPAPTASSGEQDTVRYLGAEWTLLKKEGNNLTIRNPQTQKERTITLDQLD